MAETEKDDVTGTETTGHEWDGIKELNTPLPRWWVWVFYATVVWAVGYMVAYPAIPLIKQATGGMLGYSSRANVEAEMVAWKQSQGKFISAIASKSLEEIQGDEDLRRFAITGGSSAYAVNCSQCHGSGAAGGPGYPNLNDDAWLWGGDLDAIYTSIAHGIRFEQDDQTRFSLMPAFGQDDLLNDQQIEDVAHYVRSLADLEHDAQAATTGQEHYELNCAACHKSDGSGDQFQGAPALNDAIWLYGKSVEEIAAQISAPKHGVMPAWAHRLDDTTIKQLALFVYSRGGGE